VSELEPQALAGRVPAALGVIDAILKGTGLPEPSADETKELGLADFDPELRYRVAKDVIEQAYGKPKQQVELESTFNPTVLMMPSFVSVEPAPQAIAGTVLELEDGDDDEEEARDG
jgi:hypothetical protein